MDRSKLSERMQRHLDSSERTLVRQEKAVARHEGILGRHTEVLNRQDGQGEDWRAFLRQQSEDLRTFLRELNLRNERIVQELVDHIHEFTVAQTKRTDEILAELRDGREESRAQRMALLALIDRLPPADVV